MTTWWNIMVTIGTANWLIALYLLTRSFTWKRKEPENANYFRILSICGIIFSSVSLYRSIFVSSYPNRLAWFDSFLNSPFLIRSLAMFAEMSFIGLIAVILLKLNKDMKLTNNSALSKTPYIALACIFVAQFFAFGGLIAQSMLQFAIEETLWGIAFVSIFPLVIVGLRKVMKQADVGKSCKIFFIIMTVWCTGYLAFQFLYALPFMYWAEVHQDIGKVVAEDALSQAIWNYRMTRDFNEWGGIGFFIWHSGYFSVCVWMALFFMTAPRKTRAIT